MEKIAKPWSNTRKTQMSHCRNCWDSHYHCTCIDGYDAPRGDLKETKIIVKENLFSKMQGLIILLEQLHNESFFKEKYLDVINLLQKKVKELREESK